jgi:predicted aspartyl protease
MGDPPPRSGRDDAVGEVFASVTIVNLFDRTKQIECRALVDTGSAGLVLPMAWIDRLGALQSTEPISFEVADQRIVRGEVGGPVSIQLDGFRRFSGDVFFMDMTPDDGEYQPLVGYVVLEQSLAVVDMAEHKLVQGRRHFPLKETSIAS